MHVAKTKALISFAVTFAVTAKLICVFVFAYAKCWFSHDTAHILCDISWRFDFHFITQGVCIRIGLELRTYGILKSVNIL